MDLQLYSYYRSSCAYRVRIALNLKKQEYDYKAIHLLNNGGEQKSSDYLKLNPKAEVPTLIHDKTTLTQSMAIIEYLDEVFPEPALFPEDLKQKALVRATCEIINSGIQPLQNLSVQQRLKGQFNLSDEAKQNWLTHWIEKGLQAVEDLIAPHSGNFSFSDQITAADIFIVPQVFSSERFNVDIGKYPNIQKVYENCKDIQAFYAAHPSRQPDTPEEV